MPLLRVSLVMIILQHSADQADKAVVNFFKPISQKDPIKTAWRTVDGSLLVCKYDKVDEYIQNAPRRVAAFDLVRDVTRILGPERRMLRFVVTGLHADIDLFG